MNTYFAEGRETSVEGFSLDIPPYAFHLLAGNISGESFTLNLNYEGDMRPTKLEIENFLYLHTLGYALSRWFEWILFRRGVPASITPVSENDWSREKIITARGGQCPIYFIDEMERFGVLCQELEKTDAMIVYVGGLDIPGTFLPYIDQVIDIMLSEKEVVFKKRELKEGVPLEKMLMEAPMTFAVRPEGIKGVSVNGSNIKGHISFKIMDRIRELLKKAGASGKMNEKKNLVRGTQQNTGTKVELALRL